MAMLTVSTLLSYGGSSLHFNQCLFSCRGGKLQNFITVQEVLPTNRRVVLRALAAKKTERKRKSYEKPSKDSSLVKETLFSVDNERIQLSAKISNGGDGNPTTVELTNGEATENMQASCPTRTAVLQACILTSGLLLSIGLALRQASHVAAIYGWPIPDPTKVSFDFEMWHLELIIGLAILIATSRYVLLSTWSDFANSSEAANKQILTSLEPLDYVLVAFLPGISEEVLFRGAVMPLFGLNWTSALITGAVFGVLHLGNGRRYPYAIWATLVGFMYGMVTIASSSLIVPMASHSINNLIGGLLWRFTSSPQEKNK